LPGIFTDSLNIPLDHSGGTGVTAKEPENRCQKPYHQPGMKTNAHFENSTSTHAVRMKAASHSQV